MKASKNDPADYMNGIMQTQQFSLAKLTPLFWKAEIWQTLDREFRANLFTTKGLDNVNGFWWKSLKSFFFS